MPSDSKNLIACIINIWASLECTTIAKPKASCRRYQNTSRNNCHDLDELNPDTRLPKMYVNLWLWDLSMFSASQSVSDKGKITSSGQ
jgi:hypothetical protein